MNSNQHLLLQRLSLLRMAIFGLWLVFLLYLQFNHFANLGASWLLLAGYFALLTIGAWQAWCKPVHSWQLLVHLAIECQLLAGLLFFSGGASNPLISCYLLLLVFAAYSLPLRFSLLITLITLVDYSVLTQWYLPLLSHKAHGLTSSSLFSLHLAGMWLTFVMSAIIFVTLIPQLLHATRQQQIEIQKLREQQLKNEQIIGIATLAAGTAHEMGTPLMTMHMLLEELEQSPQTPLHIDDLAILKAQVKQCRTSLKQLANAGRQAYNVGSHAALPWLHSLLKRWRLSHPNAQWHVVDIERDAIVSASPLLDQALLNLLDNAAEAGSLPVKLTTHITAQFWQLYIEQPDNNAANQLQNLAIFKSEKDHGMGLGLYLSNASVEQFGGSIHLQAIANGGSLSILQLPILTSHQEAV